MKTRTSIILSIIVLAGIVVVLVSYAWVRDKSDSINGTEPAPTTITVLTPIEAEQWVVSSLQEIKWSADKMTGNVKIELSRDGGITFETLLDSTPNDGSESWTVTGPATTQAMLRISSVDDPLVSDTSDMEFMISEPPR